MNSYSLLQFQILQSRYTLLSIQYQESIQTYLALLSQGQPGSQTEVLLAMLKLNEQLMSLVREILALEIQSVNMGSEMQSMNRAIRRQQTQWRLQNREIRRQLGDSNDRTAYGIDQEQTVNRQMWILRLWMLGCILACLCVGFGHLKWLGYLVGIGLLMMVMAGGIRWMTTF